MQDADRGSCEETRKGYIKESNMKILNSIYKIDHLLMVSALTLISFSLYHLLPVDIYMRVLVY